MSDKMFKNDTLLPCDYCGGGRRLCDDGGLIDEAESWYGSCNECGADWPWVDDKQQAIEVANRNCWRIVARDGLPEERGAYLVQFKCGGITCSEYAGERSWLDDEAVHQFTGVVAWMPLPGPAKTEERNT